ncbi:MAG: HesA/MoeB/ThiF family protein, partial [Candidatus Binatia bacterium]
IPDGVLVVGAGGLGSTALLALAAGGVPRLGIVDGDRVESSNLHRQILHLPGDVGRNKAEVAARRMRDLVSDVHVVPERIGRGNVKEIVSGYRFVIDATDDAATKFLLNDAAVACGTALSHAGVVGLAGQMLTILPGASACLRCLFPEPPAPGEIASCQQAGILGPLAGMIGAIQASEALRVIHGEPPALADRLLTIDARSMRIREVPLRRSPDCPVCGAFPTIRHFTPESHTEEIQ